MLSFGNSKLSAQNSRLMIDLHSHILPGLDDGTTTLAEALALGRMAAADGIHTIVATPHSPASSASRRYSAAGAADPTFPLTGAAEPRRRKRPVAESSS